MAGGGGLCFVLFKLLPIWLSIFLIIPVAVLSILLVFYKINDKPFSFYLQAGLNYLISSKLFIWKQRLVKPENKDRESEALPMVSVVPTTTGNKLKDLSWNLDVKDENSRK